MIRWRLGEALYGSFGLARNRRHFVLALLLFGPKKLPELGKNLAKAIGEFRRASSELKQTWSREMETIERETRDIKKEAESLGQVATDYNSDSSYNYNYDYDSSYDYGAYGYPDSGTLRRR
jgi:sec-independent protein translocase protein TatA